MRGLTNENDWLGNSANNKRYIEWKIEWKIGWKIEWKIEWL